MQKRKEEKKGERRINKEDIRGSKNRKKDEREGVREGEKKCEK